MKPARILLVDDDESLRETLAANLELDGLEIVEADCASRALELASAEEFDAVLSDVRMPGMGGVDLFLELKRLRPELPVVLMTAFSTEDTVRRAVSAGVFAVLAKPFDVERTLRTLQRALRHPIVVVVDDTEAVATTTAEALCAGGVRAKAVFDAASALALVERGETDVCVTDLAMPAMSGVELARRVREVDPTVYVIAFSGAADGENLIRQASAEGVFRCLRKPLDPGELISNIATARGAQR